MKFRTGDKVRVTADKKRLVMCGIRYHDLTGKSGTVISICKGGVLPYNVRMDDKETCWFLAAKDLELVEQEQDAPIRTFKSGATRDTAQGKLDYIKALSPIVLKRYVQYLDKHRLQPDGSYRDFDNWKKGIPQETYRSSQGRHFFDDWLLSEGYTTEDNHGPVTDIEDVLCAQLFNIQGRLHEILKAKPVDRTASIEGGY